MNKIPIYEYETKHGTKYGFRFYGGQDTNKDYSKTIQKRGFKDFDSALSAYMDTKKRLKTGNQSRVPNATHIKIFTSYGLSSISRILNYRLLALLKIFLTNIFYQVSATDTLLR